MINIENTLKPKLIKEFESPEIRIRHKLLKVGLCTIRNEAEYIEGWASMLFEFCDRVVALVDPHTTDNTVEILKLNCPRVEIVYQDRSLGDSDNEIEGPTGKTIMHANKTKWIQENIADGDWFMEMAADERFHPSQRSFLKTELLYAFKHNYDAIVHRDLYEPINVNTAQLVQSEGQWFIDTTKYANGETIEQKYVIDWHNVWVKIAHCRFQKKYPGWEQNSTPHSGFKDKCYNPLYSQVPIWHFHRIKYDSVLPTSWRDKRGSISSLLAEHQGKIPIIPIYQFSLEVDHILGLVNKHSYAEQQRIKALEQQARTAWLAQDKKRKASWPSEWKHSTK